MKVCDAKMRDWHRESNPHVLYPAPYKKEEDVIKNEQAPKKETPIYEWEGIDKEKRPIQLETKNN